MQQSRGTARFDRVPRDGIALSPTLGGQNTGQAKACRLGSLRCGRRQTLHGSNRRRSGPYARREPGPRPAKKMSWSQSSPGPWRRQRMGNHLKQLRPRKGISNSASLPCHWSSAPTCRLRSCRSPLSPDRSQCDYQRATPGRQDHYECQPGDCPRRTLTAQPDPHPTGTERFPTGTGTRPLRAGDH